MKNVFFYLQIIGFSFLYIRMCSLNRRCGEHDSSQVKANDSRWLVGGSQFMHQLLYQSKTNKLSLTWNRYAGEPPSVIVVVAVSVYEQKHPLAGDKSQAQPRATPPWLWINRSTLASPQ